MNHLCDLRDLITNATREELIQENACLKFSLRSAQRKLADLQAIIGSGVCEKNHQAVKGKV
jgi:hypothetical protein